jgi:hypothetical protein
MAKRPLIAREGASTTSRQFLTHHPQLQPLSFLFSSPSFSEPSSKPFLSVPDELVGLKEKQAR